MVLPKKLSNDGVPFRREFFGRELKVIAIFIRTKAAEVLAQYLAVDLNTTLETYRISREWYSNR